MVSVVPDNFLDDDMSNGLKATIKEKRQAKIGVKAEKSKVIKSVIRTGTGRDSRWTA